MRTGANEAKSMVDIINGDSLAGLLTTLGFFTMLIVGRRVRMRQVSRKDRDAFPLHQTPPQE